MALIFAALAGMVLAVVPLWIGFHPSKEAPLNSVASSGPVAIQGSFLIQASEGADHPAKLYILSIGGEPKRLSLDGGAPSVSPDGRSVLATRIVSESENELVVVDIGTEKEHVVTGFDSPQESDWSPLGDWIAFVTQHGDIYKIHPDGTGLARVTDPGSACLDGPPGWSPDGASIVFGRTCDGGEGNPGLYIVQADGSELRRITDEPGIGRPAWSPDGATIAFTKWDKDDRPAIYLVSPDGTGMRLFTTDAGSPSWSPQGDAVAVARSGDVEILDLAGNATTASVSTPGLTVSSVEWSPTSG